MSAHISVETSGELSRKVTVSIPASELLTKHAARVKELAKTADFKGFRKGAVPIRLIQQRFGRSVRYEIMDDMMRTALQEAYEKHNITPALAPTIENLQEHAEGKDLSFVAVVEVLPEVTPIKASDLKIEKLEVTVSDADIDTAVQQFLESKASFEAVDRAGKPNDKAMVDIKEAVNDAAFPEEYVEDIELPIMEKGEDIKVIPGLLEGLIGKKAGDTFEVETGFPENWADTSMAGKKVKYAIRVKTIQERTLPALTDEFVQSQFGEKETVDSFKAKMKEELEKLAENIQKTDMHNQAIEGLLHLQLVKLPYGLVMEEAHQQYHRQHHQHQNEAHDFEKELAALSEEARTDLMQRARREVALSILLAAEFKHYDLKVNQEALSMRAIQYVQQFPEPGKVLEQLRRNEGFIRQLRFDDLVAQWSLLILKDASISTRALSLEAARSFKRDVQTLPDTTVGKAA